MDAWAALFQLAARQHGAVARSQARRLGIDNSTFTRRVRRELWPQPHRSVFQVPGIRPGFLTCVAAALLAVGDHAAATAQTALHLHGVTEKPPTQVVLVVPHGRRAPRLSGVRIIRSRTLTDEDRTTVRRLECVTAQRAFVDTAPACDRGVLRVMLIDARQRGVVVPANVIARAAAVPPRAPGRGRLLAAAHDVDAIGADSVLSDLVHRRLIDEGLRPDSHPVTVRVDRDRRLRPDITFARSFVCIECDSLAHHSTQGAIDLDHRKDESYSCVRWKCLRIGWHRYDNDWAGFVAGVRHELEQWPRVVAALGR
jgi:hypothetical protein